MDSAGLEGLDGGDTGEEGLSAPGGTDTEDDGGGGVEEMAKVGLLVLGAGFIEGLGSRVRFRVFVFAVCVCFGSIVVVILKRGCLSHMEESVGKPTGNLICKPVSNLSGRCV